MTATVPPVHTGTAPLPAARGPLSEAALALLRGEDALETPDTEDADPYGDDLHLALHCCYELHYRGFAGVDDDREWDPRLLALRAGLERAFLAALRADVEPDDDDLFADMMRELDLSADYGHYVDAVPAATLAEVNFMSLCGLRRSLRGALVGQFALVEVTSSPGSERLVRGMRRLGCGPAAIRFYDEHVEADAAHEQVVRRGVLAPLLAEEPALAADVVFGIRAAGYLGDRLGALLLDRWDAGCSSLRRSLPVGPGR